MAKTKIGVLASGRGSNLQAVIDAVESGEIEAEIVVVVSDRKDAKALERARKHNIEAVFIDPSESLTRNEYDQKIVSCLRKRWVDLVLLAGYMRIIGMDFIETYRNRILNIHPALLPSFPGLHAQSQALEYGVKVSGCTVHFVDERVDHGPIILQETVPVLEDDTEDSLAARILEREHKIYPHAVKLFCEGKLKVDGRSVRILA